MEARIITVVSSTTNAKYEINSTAETLAGLKKDLDSNNIYYQDLTFYEGLTKTELVSDDSLLPKDVLRNGQTTNNLVFLLTSKKKIESGVSRKELYSIIKERNLQDAISFNFGKNYTNVSTVDLEYFLKCGAEDNHKVPEYTQEEKEAVLTEFEKLLRVLKDKNVLSEDDVKYISENNKPFTEEKRGVSLYSDEEIKKMFADIVK